MSQCQRKRHKVKAKDKAKADENIRVLIIAGSFFIALVLLNLAIETVALSLSVWQMLALAGVFFSIGWFLARR